MIRKLLKKIMLSEYKQLSNSHTIDEIAKYNSVELRKCYYEFGVAIQELQMNKKMYSVLVTLIGCIWFLPIISELFDRFCLVVYAASGGHSQSINFAHISRSITIVLICYLVLIAKINRLIAELTQKYKEIDFYMFIDEIRNYGDEVNARMLLFDKDDRLDTYFDSNRRRTIKLFSLGVILLFFGLFIILISKRKVKSTAFRRLSFSGISMGDKNVL